MTGATIARRPVAAAIGSRPRTRRRWLVSAYCPRTGPWREYVTAATAREAVEIYAEEHAINPRLCSAASD
jgi:hypothetical protein